MRSLKRIVTAPFRSWHYKTIWNLRRISKPAEFLRRYVFESGHYPWTLTVSLEGARVDVTVWSHADLFTVAEVFLQECYQSSTTPTVVLDLGGNIGLSSLYFLVKFPACRVIAYEPSPVSIERFRTNTRDFKDRIDLREAAVATSNGHVDFGVESTGRYSGIGVPGTRTISVASQTTQDIFASLQTQDRAVDLVKVDIEGAEQWVIPAIASLEGRRPVEVLVEGNEFDPAVLVSRGFKHRLVAGLHRFVRSEGAEGRFEQQSAARGASQK